MRMSTLIPRPREASFSGESVGLDETWGTDDRSGIAGIAAQCIRLLGIAPEKRAGNVTLDRANSLRDEQYKVKMAQGGITVSAASDRGFHRALSTLKQLRRGPTLPVGDIADSPRLPIRGFHLNFASLQQIGSSEAVALIESAADLKLNTLLIEFADRFPFQKHARIAAPDALSPDELRAILEHARSLGFELIPLLQSLGHLDYVLRHDEYADLREEDEHRDQMCPLNEKSLRLFTELAEEILSFFPAPRFMHIGADETRRLGVCPRCREKAAADGKGALFLEHTNKVCSWLSDRGLTPILWDDMACGHPYILDGLHPNAWIMYWDYWTTDAHRSPLLVARYRVEGNDAIVYDRRWDGEWRAELSDVQAAALSTFAQPADMAQFLGDDFLQVYGDCLGDDFPKFVRPFPYLEYFQSHNRRVIGAPTCAGNTSDWLSLPDFPRYGANIKAFADRCIEAGAEGLVTSAWYNWPPQVFDFGLVATAQFTW